MIEFPDITTSIGKYIEIFINWLATTFEGFFDFIFFIASRSINGIDHFLVWLPWWLFILIVLVLGWYFKSLLWGITFSIFIFLIGTFGFWEDMMITISIIIASVAISLIICIPLGIWMAFSQWFSNIMRPLLDAMQTMPSFVYLIPAIFFFGLGNVSAIFATLIYAVPPVIRLTELAIRCVGDEIIESAYHLDRLSGKCYVKFRYHKHYQQLWPE